MKKSIFTLGLMSAILALSSCVKDNTDTATDLGHKQITQTVTLGDETRSSYKPGEGITIDKNESMTVYYMANDDEDLSTYVFAGKLSASNDGNNNFTFSHDAIEGATAYDYYFMMPDNSSNNMNGGKVASTHRLGQVQRPSATSFDPSFDYIVGKPATIAAENMNAATVIDYKRLVAPLCITFNDSEGLLSGQKIHSVNVVASATASQAASLQGLFYVNYSDVFADCKISSWDKTSVSNGMTASYDEGIEQEGSWESWFMVRDVTIPAGDMTVTIVGDKNTIKRTFSMGEFTTVMDKINRLSINLSSSNCTITKSFTVDFSATTKLPASVTTSEGQTLAFSATTCQIATNATNGNSLQINKGGSFTLPAPAEGLKYKAIYLTEQNTNGTKDYIIAAYSGENEISSGNFNYYNEALRNNGGVLKLDIAEEYGADAITIKRTDSEANNYCRIIRLTVEYEGEAVQPEPEPEPTATDYYTEYSNGKDITVNGYTYKAGEYTAVLCDATTADKNFRSLVNKKADDIIVFVDSDDNGEFAAYNSDNVNVYGNLVFMSRYSDHKAKMRFDNYWKFATTVDHTTSLTLLNLDIVATTIDATKYIFNNSDAAADMESFILNGCSLEVTTQRFYQSNKPEFIIKNIAIENNVFKFTYNSGTNNHLFDFKATGRISDIKSFTLNNNLLYNSNEATCGLAIINYGNGTAQTVETQNTDVVCTNNTFIDVVGRDVYFKGYKFQSFTVSNNIFYGTETGVFSSKNSVLFRMYATSTVSPDDKTLATDVVNTCTISNNIHYGFNGWNNYDSSSGFIPQTSNTQKKLEATPFSTFDRLNGNFVVASEYAEYGYQAK